MVTMMDIILLEKVENLGNLGDKVRVKPGYGRNFLIPSGKAVRATPERIKEFEARRAELEKAAAEAKQQAETRRAGIDGTEISIGARVAGEGQLYGSVATPEIAEALAAAGHTVERQELRLPEDGPIREVGTYEIMVHLHADVDATITLHVTAEE